ncbi:MAG: arginine--tRNA ligase [Acidimicrobiales bacterium]
MLRDDLTAALRAALEAAGVAAPAGIGLERPARREHGDWSSNVALATAKAAGRNPRQLGQALVDHLNANPPRHVTKVALAGPGFVNFHLGDSWLHDVLRDVVESGEDGFAAPDVGQGRRVNVEFVSANPTGPIHAGHVRGACFGDSVARLFARCGHVVHREFYVNDRGVQMQHYAASLAARKRGEDVHEDGYHGDYIVDWASELPDDADPVLWGRDRALADQQDVLGRLGVHFDTWFSESSMVATGAIDAALADLRERGVVFEQDGAVWLRSSDFGDTRDRVLVRSDGEPTYLLPDIAYHRDKFTRGWQLLFDVWGADHHGQVPSLRAALRALGHDESEFEVALCQMVRLEREGRPVTIAKRTGELIELRELLDEIGPDAVRLVYLMQSVNSEQTVDLALLVQQSMDNPVYYVQYAHARIASIGKRAAELGVQRAPLESVDPGVLTHERELDVLRSLSELPEVVAMGCLERAPHKVTSWVRELAGRFHGFYHDCYVIGDVPPEVTQARLWLVEAARIGLRIGLGLLGVTAPESM